MLITSEIIAKKYALAFLHASSQELSQDLIQQIANFGIFLQTQKSITAHLSLPTLNSTAKEDIIGKITTHFSLNNPFKKMLSLLMEQKRITLLELIIKHIVRQYQKSCSLGIFYVSSSHPLQEQEKQRIIDFITNQVSYKKIQAIFVVDATLISGLRIQSDTLLWERSVNRLLQRAQQCTFQRAGL